MSDRSKTRLYYAACICLLIAAAALRFYDLSGGSLGYDEAVAANNSRGSLGEVLDKTRNSNSSPILYPLVLYAVQEVESSRMSVRIVPAIASVLTVAAILFLLPRVGVSRWAALVAALLSMLSLSAIEHARNGREYSIDAFVAVLMIAGLLAYLRGRHGGGTYGLFGILLFVAPLVQYGLVLFGIAILGTIAVMEGKTLWSRRDTLRDGLLFPAGWVWQRLAYFAWLAACFAAGSVTSYAVTLRYQWVPGGHGGEVGDYLAAHYYSGRYGDVPAMIEFVLSRTEVVLRYHTPELLAVLGLAGFGVYVIVSIGKRRLDAVAILLLFSIAIAGCAALLRMYPYGDTRQCLYLAPIIFLAFGYALHSIAVDASSLTRRAWPAHVGMTLAAGVIAFSGTASIRDSDLYRNYPDVEDVLMTLEQQVREGDVVYVSSWIGPSVEFYHKGQRDGYCLSGDDSLRGVCARRLFWERHRAERMWLLVDQWTAGQIVDAFSTGQNDIELVKDHGMNLLYVWLDPFQQERDALLSAYQYTANVEPGVRSVFDVYVREGRLIYVKEPCVLGDVAARFFLHVTPVDVEDLPEERKEHGFDNLDFDFSSFGMMEESRCIGVHDLPEYDIDSISTGQFGDDGRIWEGEFSLGESDALLSAYQYAVNSAPAAQSVFDVYGGDGRLIYVKEPCVLGDVAARFFLHVTPVDVKDLPEERKEHGFDNLDFDFSSHGIVAEGRCIAARDLPGYDIDSISTGQFAEDGEIWRSEFTLDE